jgi:PAS domain S-box-containing protein
MIDALTMEGRDDEAIGIALECLRMFGIEMPPHPSAAEVESGFQEIWTSLGGRSIEEIVDLPLMEDPEMQAAMEVLSRLYAPAYHSDNNLFYLHLCHGVNLSLRHGNCAASTHAYGWFGITLARRFRRPAEGYRFARMALELMERHGFVAYKAKAHFQMRLISYWTQSLDRMLEFSHSAFEAAMETGDVPVACFSCNHTIWGMLVRGDRLEEVHREVERRLDFVRRSCFQDVHDMIVGVDRLVQSMRGCTRNPSSFDDRDFGEGRFEAAIAGRMPTLRLYYYVAKLMGRFLAGDLDGALAAAEQCREVLWAGLFSAQAQCYHLYHALALAAAADDLSPEQRKRTVDLLLAHQEELGDPALFHPATFRGPRALLSAEIARVRGDEEAAAQLYDEALRAAREGGFVQNEALVAELTSRFYRARGLDLVADGFLRHARACYARWGADGKVRQLDERHPGLLEPGTTARDVFAAPAEQLDLVSVVKASQTISSELVEELASTLLTLVLEQGGARKGYLLLSREGALCIQAEATLEQAGIATRILDSLPLETSRLLPVSAIRQAQRTREAVVLEDPTDAAGFASDAYFADRRPRSALCLPIVRRENLIGLLYLENELVPGAFTPARLAALTLLASQAAISMEDALLLSHERASRERAERATQALRESEARLRLAEEAAKAGIWEWDLRTNENFWSEGIWKLYDNLPRSVQPSYQSWRATIHPEDRARAEEVVQEAARRGTEINLEWRVLTRDGTTRWLMSRGRPLRDAGGQAVRYLGIVLDITDRKHAEEELRQENRRKSDFLGVLSHELRNPLAPIRNSTFILDRAPPGSWEAARAKEIIKRQTEHLSRLVDDLLDVTRISRGKIELRRERLDLREIVRRTAEDLHTMFEQREIRLFVALAPHPVWVDADATRISQAVGNLLQNATKFTAARGVVSVMLEEEGAMAVVRVSDDGEGIDRALLGHVFEPFVQAERGLARQRGGLGLGLALVKGLIELHEGSVSAASEGPGRGSQFTIRLPLASHPAAGCARPDEPRTTGARSILIIEDNPDAGQSLADAMALSGHCARVARDGRSGLALAREIRPDVILCDIGLPDIDGFEVARTLRADWALRSTRLIALSGYAQPGDKQRAREAGFDAHLRKPPSLDELRELLAGRADGAGHPTGANPEP